MSYFTFLLSYMINVKDNFILINKYKTFITLKCFMAVSLYLFLLILKYVKTKFHICKIILKKIMQKNPKPCPMKH